MSDVLATVPSTSAYSASDATLVAGRNCWRIESATRAAFLVDGEEFFGAVRATLARAGRSFYILGWDIDSRMKLAPGANDGLPPELGPFLNEIVARRKGMRGHVLAWDYAALYALEREWWSVLRLARRSRLAFRLDDRHPLGASHHQKVIVVDDEVAFVSGFDLAGSRWDTSEHACHQPLRKNVIGMEYGPFHDVGMMVEGHAPARSRICAATAGGARPAAMPPNRAPPRRAVRGPPTSGPTSPASTWPSRAPTALRGPAGSVARCASST